MWRLALLIGAALALGATPALRPRFVSLQEAQPVLDALEDSLPSELKQRPSAARWTEWVTRRDSEIRSRLADGEEDSLANLLLYGTSFTTQPRLTPELMGQTEEKARASGRSGLEEINRIFATRVDDMIQTLGRPGSDERLLVMRALAERKGYDAATAAGRDGLKAYLAANVGRVRQQYAEYAAELAEVRKKGDPTAEMIVRSRLFRNRGISLDTSFPPNFALEETLRAAASERWLPPLSVRRVAIVGPGLDFVDKQEGYDFYPPQTMQPFAVVDSLVRLGLAKRDDVEVTTFDISARVNDHIARAAERARKGEGYLVEVPRDPTQPWKAEAMRYWEAFGDRIGTPVRGTAPPAAAGPVEVRTVRVAPDVVAHVTAVDMNVVFQRLDLPADRAFDLVVATNILVYYDVFEQSLALGNVEAMLRPGGFLLSNNALLELPSSSMRSVAYKAVAYSDRPHDGDRIICYRKGGAARP